MGIRSFFEDALRIKFRPNKDPLNSLPIVSDKQDITYKQMMDGDAGSLIDAEAISKFRSLSTNRQERYSEFENLLSDATISAAIEMYADDATQYNYRTGKVIWAESDDVDIQKAANRLIDVLGINEKSWTYIYALCVYGDVYLRLYRDGDVSDYTELYDSEKRGQSVIRIKPKDAFRKIEEYIEYVDDPATMYDLQERNKTAGFVRVTDSDTPSKSTPSATYNSVFSRSININDIDLYDATSFIHICLSGNIDRHPELMTVTDSKTGATSVYKVKTGKSILADAYPASQTVALLEDSMMMNRLTKSALIRILQIEVGNIPKPEAESILHRVKSLIEQKIALNKQNGVVASYNSPGPMENVIYVPTKEGKGAITATNLGGDVNVKDIVDVDYFNNKKLSALKIPKQYLNYDAPEGLGNGTSLTKLSSRYAHTIMRIQNAYISGITTLLNIMFADKGLDYINKFTLKMVSPATLEDTERDEQIQNRLDQASSIIQLLTDIVDEAGIKEVLEWLLSDFLSLSDIAEIVKKYTVDRTPENGKDSDVDFNFEGPGPGSFDSGQPDFGSEASFDEMEFEEPVSEEPTITPEA